MSRFVLLILSMVIPMVASQGQESSQDVAIRQTARFLTSQKAQGEILSDTEAHLTLAAKTKACYVFNVGNSGWAVSSSNDKNARVLAFSSDGHLDADKLPEQLKALLAIYDGTAGLQDAEPTSTSTDRQDAIGTMLTTKWGEYAPYNSLCPQVPSEDGETIVTAPAGSATVAMAQLMRYYRWPLAVKDIEHTSWHLTDYPFPDYGKLPDTTFDWDAMPDCLNADAGSEAYEVARLMKYIGYASRSYYHYKSTAVIWNDVVNTLKKFGYDARMESINPFIDRPVSDKAIYDELSAGRPVLVLVRLLDEIQNHVAVVDGYCYMSEYGCGYYHVNWGWNGEGNGFYYLPTDQTAKEGMSSYFYTMKMITASKVESANSKGGDATGIDSMHQDSSNSGGYFDLQGRRFTTQPRRGLYIKDGKKIVVK